jgi:PIN domain nuclease of toxin-antitoxin system
VSCLEVAWLARKERGVLPVPIDDFFVKAIDEAGLMLLPLTPKIAARSAFLPDIHRDPIDRVLIATALEHDADFISKDALIARYPEVRVRWAV